MVYHHRHNLGNPVEIPIQKEETKTCNILENHTRFTNMGNGLAISSTTITPTISSD